MRSDVTLELLKFIDDALRDVATLSQLKQQYCRKHVHADVARRMDRLEDTIGRIVSGSTDMKVPGMSALIDQYTHAKGQIPLESIMHLRRKFTETFRELTNLMIEHCRIKGTTFRLPDLNIDITVPRRKGTCESVPKEMQQWYDRDDDGWTDKQILCIGMHRGHKVDLPIGHILHDRFEVVIVSSDKTFYGVARKEEEQDCSSFACRILRMIYAGSAIVIGMIKTIINMLFSTITLVAQGIIALTPTIASWVVRYWKMVIAAVVIAIITQTLGLVPRSVVNLVLRMINEARDIVTGTVVKSSVFVHNIASMVLSTIAETVDSVKPFFSLYSHVHINHQSYQRGV
jgi:hypothetical protein